MDKLQRKINNAMKKNQKGFDEWYRENHFVLGDFDGRALEIPNSNTVAKARKVWVSIAALLLLIAFCLSIVVPIVLSNGSNDFEFTFSERDVYTIELSDSEFDVVNSEYPFIHNMEINLRDGLYLKSDMSLVMAIVRGEIETEDNFYLLDVQIEYNKNYNFIYKPIYEDLSDSIQIGEWSITYENTSIDLSGLYVYLFRMVNSEEQVVYIEAHCFVNDISYILDEFIC